MFNNEKQLITVLPVHQWRRSAARSGVFTPRGCQASPNIRSTLPPGNLTYTLEIPMCRIQCFPDLSTFPFQAIRVLKCNYVKRAT